MSPFPTTRSPLAHNFLSIRAKDGSDIGVRCIACKLSVYEGEKVTTLHGTPFPAQAPCPGMPQPRGYNFMPPDCFIENWPPHWHKES